MLFVFLQSFGPVADISETVVMQMGCIARGLSNSDLENLPFLLEALEGIGHCGWNESQVLNSNINLCFLRSQPVTHPVTACPV